MEYLVLPILSLLLLWVLAGAALPFTVLADRRRAVTRRRSLYDKSADQIGALTWLVQALLALVLAADLLGGGLIDRFAAGPWRLFWLGTVGGSALAAVFSLFGWAGGRRARAGSSGRFVVWLAGLSAVAAACCALPLVWAFLRGAGLETGTVAELSPAPAALAAFKSSVGGLQAVPAVVFGLLCVALAPTAALAAGLCWQVLRRGADDFGRDYYAVTVGGRARRAAYAGAALLLFAAALLWITPVFNPTRLPFLLPGGAERPGVALGVFGAGCLGLPLAVLGWYLTARSAVPLRRKTLIFLAPVLLWIGVVCLLARLWA